MEIIMRAKIYSKNDCGWCVKSKELLEQHKIEVVEFNIEYRESWKTMLKDECGKLGFIPKTVPQIWINDNYVGGYEELYDFIYPSKES